MSKPPCQIALLNGLTTYEPLSANDQIVGQVAVGDANTNDTLTVAVAPAGKCVLTPSVNSLGSAVSAVPEKRFSVRVIYTCPTVARTTKSLDLSIPAGTSGDNLTCTVTVTDAAGGSLSRDFVFSEGVR